LNGCETLTTERGFGAVARDRHPERSEGSAWLGPAPKVPYNVNRTFYRFRWFYDYSGGQVSNMGAHYLDYSHGVLGHDAPLAVTAVGGKYVMEDKREIRHTRELIWSYPGNALITFTQLNASGAAALARDGTTEIRGTKGTLDLTWGGYEVVLDAISCMHYPALTPLDRGSNRWRSARKTVIEPQKVEEAEATPRHARNILDCVRSRKLCNCDIETGHPARAVERRQKVAHGVSSATRCRVNIYSPGGATDSVGESPPPLRGSGNPGSLLGPTAYAVGYSLWALRASVSGDSEPPCWKLRH